MTTTITVLLHFELYEMFSNISWSTHLCPLHLQFTHSLSAPAASLLRLSLLLLLLLLAVERCRQDLRLRQDFGCKLMMGAERARGKPPMTRPSWPLPQPAVTVMGRRACCCWYVYSCCDCGCCCCWCWFSWWLAKAAAALLAMAFEASVITWGRQ